MTSRDFLTFALSRTSQESVCCNFAFAEDVEVIVVTVLGDMED